VLFVLMLFRHFLITAYQLKTGRSVTYTLRGWLDYTFVYEGELSYLNGDAVQNALEAEKFQTKVDAVETGMVDDGEKPEREVSDNGDAETKTPSLSDGSDRQ